MAQAIVDPQEVRVFATELRKFANEIEQNMKRTEARLSRLGLTWKDQEHRKFEENFKQSVIVLKPLINDINKYIGFLGRKAQAAEEYLNRR